jgi:hypothetical protein
MDRILSISQMQMRLPEHHPVGLLVGLLEAGERLWLRLETIPSFKDGMWDDFS